MSYSYFSQNTSLSFLRLCERLAGLWSCFEAWYNKLNKLKPVNSCKVTAVWQICCAVVVNTVWSRVFCVPCMWSDDPPPYEHNFLSNCVETPEKFRYSLGFELLTSLCWPVRCSNQLSYKVTDGGSCSVVSSNVPMMNETIDKMILYLQFNTWFISWIYHFIIVMNTSKIPSELSHGNFISSHLKITCYLPTWRDHCRYGYIINHAFESKLIWYFSGVYIINRILLTCSWIWILSSHVQLDISLIRCAHSWDIELSMCRPVISSIYPFYFEYWQLVPPFFTKTGWARSYFSEPNIKYATQVHLAVWKSRFSTWRAERSCPVEFLN